MRLSWILGRVCAWGSVNSGLVFRSVDPLLYKLTCARVIRAFLNMLHPKWSLQPMSGRWQKGNPYLSAPLTWIQPLQEITGADWELLLSCASWETLHPSDLEIREEGAPCSQLHSSAVEFLSCWAGSWQGSYHDLDAIHSPFFYWALRKFSWVNVSSFAVWSWNHCYRF